MSSVSAASIMCERISSPILKLLDLFTLAKKESVTGIREKVIIVVKRKSVFNLIALSDADKWFLVRVI